MSEPEEMDDYSGPFRPDFQLEDLSKEALVTLCREFMIAALKDSPPTEFRTPPGLRMYRVNPGTGLPAGAGEPAIWEGYKPGTEPGKDRDRFMSGEEVAGEAAGLPVRAGPAGGTGGLY